MSDEPAEQRTSVEELPRLSLRGMRARWKLRGVRNRSLGAARDHGDGGLTQIGDNHFRNPDGTWIHSGSRQGGGGAGGV